MNDVAGWVLLGIAVLVFLYILPAAIRSRQVVVDSRAEDRYSADLRIVATAGRVPEAMTSTSRVFVHARRPEALMSSTTGVPDRQLAAADARRLAAARAARAAASSRRAAAARRRLALTALLIAVTASAWIGFAVLSWPVVAAVVATGALAGVVVLGRRAATAGNAADARCEHEMQAIKSHARGRAETQVRASGQPRLRMDVDPTVLVAEPTKQAEADPSAVEHDRLAWTPVPVPPPAYTLKQTAPRRQVTPVSAGEPTEQMPAVQGETGSDVREPVAEQPAMDVRAAIARRRAAG